ncbi:hypothetical protein DFO73_11628 [Cytobacillus oceanisediminis]|uniref:Uncharacterized protein n=1 Tax=Cytobacillus oceanisediminis TaxID=665099 RepID=A0A2V2ZKN3_9BACI|nr:hypothetical protein [Cytobacillus oceanisediminis]PWW20214.1 hypothetical protein DFO73_11628 [Cytobacillus oceanisediminis]
MSVPLPNNTIKAIDEFLSTYAESSHANMNSAVSRLLKDELHKKDVAEITFADYLKIFPNDDKKLTSNEIYMKSFFRFLFAYDFLNNPIGFNEIFKRKESIKNGFLANKLRQKNIGQNVKKEKETEVIPLTIQELILIQKVLDVKSSKLDTLKMQFCWYAVFDLGLPVEELRKKITSESYSNGYLKTSEGLLPVPEKFEIMFIQLSERSSNYNRFATADAYFEKIGEIAKLERKLIPLMIKKAKRDFSLKCGNCRKSYTNIAENWRSVNNRIVCIHCSEDLKKNEI